MSSENGLHDSFLNYRNGRYALAALALTALCIALYVWHAPLQSPNGGTWLGYTLGTVGALLIIWLILFGARKRSYSSTLGSVKGWLSAHVYLGATLLVVATLHSGFQFGWNIHTVAYALMVLVILSGFVGLYVYLRYPRLAAENRGDRSRDELLAEVVQLDRQTVRIAESVDPATRALVESAADRTEVGGGWLDQLAGRDRSKIALVADAAKRKQRLSSNADQRRLLAALTERFAKSQRGGAETERLQQLLTLIARKRELLRRVRRDIRIQALIQLWLYLHVPLSFALLGALTAHVLSVFIYW